jgi:hypothetical protein
VVWLWVPEQCSITGTRQPCQISFFFLDDHAKIVAGKQKTASSTLQAGASSLHFFSLFEMSSQPTFLKDKNCYTKQYISGRKSKNCIINELSHSWCVPYTYGRLFTFYA